MSLTIELPSNIEQQLRQDAIQKGLKLEAYLLQLLGTASGLRKTSSNNKATTESELLQKINLEITESEWENYRHLVALRKSEKLSNKDIENLIALSEKIETANAKRLDNLVKLSTLRNVSLEKTISDLGIFPVEI